MSPYSSSSSTGVFDSNARARQGCRAAAYAALEFEAMQPYHAMETAPVPAELRQAYRAVSELQGFAAEYNLLTRSSAQRPHTHEVYSAMHATTATDVAAEYGLMTKQQPTRHTAAEYNVLRAQNNVDVAASYGLLQPSAQCANARSTAAVYALYQETTRAVHQLDCPVAAHSAHHHHRSAVYTSAAPVIAASAGRRREARVATTANDALRRSVYMTQPQQHNVQPSATSGVRVAAYTMLNKDIAERSSAPSEHPTASSEQRQLAYMVLNNSIAEHPSVAANASTERQAAYSMLGNDNADHTAAAPGEAYNASRAAVYAVNNADHIEQQAPLRERPPASYKSSVYGVMNIAASVSPLARRHARSTSASKASAPTSPRARAPSTTPTTPPPTRRTRTESNASLKSAGGSVPDLTALVHGSMIRSTSHTDLQKLANVSLSSLSEELTSMTTVTPASTRPRSPATPTQRAGHLGSLSLVTRMQKLGC